jgi:hypothetical protein
VLLGCLLAWMTGSLAAGETDQAAPAFQVVPRTSPFESSPCEGCHEDLEPNPRRRVLEDAPHFAEVQHGPVGIWCTTCHSLDSQRSLQTLSGQPVGYDQSHVICGQCHAGVYRDWQFGAHGKRMTGWRGRREILNCTACHNPHTGPDQRPRRPDPPPGVRIGLERQHQHRAQHRNRYGWENPQPAQSEDADVSR